MKYVALSLWLDCFINAYEVSYHYYCYHHVNNYLLVPALVLIFDVIVIRKQSVSVRDYTARGSLLQPSSGPCQLSVLFLLLSVFDRLTNLQIVPNRRPSRGFGLDHYSLVLSTDFIKHSPLRFR